MARLHRIHRGVGIERRPLSRVVNGLLQDRWETFARSRDLPIAFDLAKIHLHFPDPQEGQTALARGLSGSIGSGPHAYSFAEQIALAHVQTLSWHDARQQRAATAGRLPQLDRVTQLRIEALSALLA